MATWYEHSATTFDPETGLFSEDMKALITNVAAGLEGANNAPYNEATWHPYNGLKVGDANTGLLYDFATTGAISTLTTPEFADGYEYRLRIVGIDTASTLEIEARLYSAATAAYTSYGIIHTALGTSPAWGTIEIARPRIEGNMFFVFPDIARSDSPFQPAVQAGSAFWVATSTKINNCQLRFNVALTAGQIMMDKRRVYA
jgi:hypothetical protein